MREANIPLEGLFILFEDYVGTLTGAIVMWNDIDLYHAFRDFTSDPVTFPGDQMREFIRELVSVFRIGVVALTTASLPSRRTSRNVSGSKTIAGRH